MGIIDKIENFINETKEMSLKKVMDKIEDGYWEAEQDLKVGKHATLRDTKTNKRIVVYITEDLLIESKASLIVSAVKKDIGLSEKEFKIAHLTGNIESPKNNDKCVIVFKNTGKPKFKVYTFDSSNKWTPGESFTDSNKLKSLWKDFPNVDYNINESSYEKDLDEGFKVKTGLQGALSINGKSIAKTQKVGNNVFVMIDKEDGDKVRILVPGGKDMLASEIAEWLEDYLKKNPKALTEATQEKDLDPNKKIVVKGVRGVKSKPFTKKFKNMAAYDKWSDSDEFGDYEIYQIMNEEFEEDSLDFILEADKMPLTLKIGDSFKTNEGSIKITDITVSSLHMKPITYITYKYDVVIDGKPLKGEEKASLDSFKDHFKK